MNNDINWNNWEKELIQKSEYIDGLYGYSSEEQSELLKSLVKTNLTLSDTKEDFLKGFGADLQKRFPNGGWRTINGARVFLNGGKVVAGLDGFNKEIDKFFDKKKEGGKKPSNEKDGEMTEAEERLYNAYLENKDAFIKQSVKSIENNNINDVLKNIQKLKESNSQKFIDLVVEVENAIKEEADKPNKAKAEYDKSVKDISKFINNKDEVDVDKLLSGNAIDNLDKLNKHDSTYRKNKKLITSPKRYIPYPGDFEGKSVKLDKVIKKVKPTEIDKALSGMVSKDELRPIITGIYNDPNGYKVSTDMHSLITVKTNEFNGNIGKTIDPKTGKEIDGNYVQWERVMPEGYRESVNMKASELNSLSSQASKFSKYTGDKDVIDINGFHFNPKRFNNFITSMRKLGVEDVKVSFSDKKDRAVIFEGKTSKGEDVKAISMPLSQDKGFNSDNRFIISQK